jgi:hypothetical protein
LVCMPIENLMMIDEQHHLDENVVEGYSMQSLSEDVTAEVEQHLLFCESCRDRVLEADAYTLALKRATKRLPAEPARARWSFRFLVPAFALAALLITVAAVRFATQGSDRPPVPVPLFAMRGTDNTAHGPAHRALLLEPDLQGLPASPTYRIQVVDAVGAPVWQGTLAAESQPPSSVIPAQLRGVYFVRVSLPSGQLLREYALEVRAKD